MKRVTSLLASVVVLTGTALAHNTGSPHQEEQGLPLLPPTVFLAGVLVLGTAVLLDAREMLPRRQANLGVAVGALGIVAGIGLLFL